MGAHLTSLLNKMIRELRIRSLRSGWRGTGRIRATIIVCVAALAAVVLVSVPGFADPAGDNVCVEAKLWIIRDFRERLHGS